MFTQVVSQIATVTSYLCVVSTVILVILFGSYLLNDIFTFIKLVPLGDLSRFPINLHNSWSENTKSVGLLQ